MSLHYHSDSDKCRAVHRFLTTGDKPASAIQHEALISCLYLTTSLTNKFSSEHDKVTPQTYATPECLLFCLLMPEKLTSERMISFYFCETVLFFHFYFTVATVTATLVSLMHLQ